MSSAGVFSPLRVLLFFALLAAPALVVAPTLRVDLLPATPSTNLQVTVTRAGVAPLIMERSVIAPLENALSSLRGLKNIRSESHQDYGFIELSFGAQADLAARRFEIASLLRSVFPKLPPGTSYPHISGLEDRSSNQARAPELLYTVEGMGTVAEVRAAAELFFSQTLLSTTSGITLSFQGGQEAVTAVEYVPGALEQYGLNPGKLSQAIQEAFSPRYLGMARPDTVQQLLVRVAPPAVTAARLAALQVRTAANTWVGLGQLARVRTYWEDPGSYFRINGQNAVGVGIHLPPEGNMVYTAAQIQSRVARAVAQQGQLRIRLEQDETVFLRQELRKNWLRTGGSLLILLVLLLLSYRQWRLLAVLITCLLVNLALTLGLSWLVGVAWHTYSLAGISVAFGLLLDNAIVVLDAYRRGTRSSIFPALAAATATTVGALLLVFLMPLEYQTNLHDFVVVTTLSLVSSLLSVFFLVPATMALWLGPRSRLRTRPRQPFSRRRRQWRRWLGYGQFLYFCKRWQGIFLLFWLLLFGLPISLLPTEIAAPPPHLYWVNSPVFQQVIRPQLTYWLGGTLQRFINNLNQETFYRAPERSRLTLEAQLPVGHTPTQLDDLMRRFEGYLQRQPGIALFKTHIYSGQYGSLDVYFDPSVEGSGFPGKLKQQLEGFAQQFSGVQWYIRGQGQSFSNNLFSSNQLNVRLVLRGYDHAELLRQAEKTGQLLAQNKRVQNVKIDQDLAYFQPPFPQLFLNFSADRLAERGGGELGVWVEAIQQRATPLTLNISTPQGYSKVQIVAQDAEAFNTAALLSDPLRPGPRLGAKIGELGQLEWRQSTGTIYREDRQYLCLVTYEYIGAYETGRKLNNRVLAQVQREMPLGFSIAQDHGSLLPEVGQPFGLLLILLGLNFFICAVLFESLKQPLVIMLTVPVALIGVWIGFANTGYAFDQGGLAALVLLGGLVVNAAIFVVHDLNQAMQQKRHHNLTLLKVLQRRAATILLAITTTICGFVPFLWEGPQVPFWFSLAFGTTAGLLFSLVAIFWVLPVLLWRKKDPLPRWPQGRQPRWPFTLGTLFKQLYHRQKIQ